MSTQTTQLTGVRVAPKVRRIRSAGVLGEFEYRIDFDDEALKNERVVVIYAENGMGKTNFLKSVHYLLTPRLESLQSLAELFVDDLSITLDSGVTIRLDKGHDLDVLMECSIEYPAKGTSAVVASIRSEDIEPRAFRRSAPRREIAMFLDELSSLVNPTVYVGDDRLVYSGTDVPAFQAGRSAYEAERELSRGRARPTQSVRESLDRVERFFTRTVLAGISKDSASSGEGVYSEITRRVLAGTSQIEGTTPPRDQLNEQVELLLSHSTDFEKYGIMPFQEVRNIADQILGARKNNTHFGALLGILGPYLSNLTDRVENLQPAQRLIDTFVASVNGFLERKHLTFSMSDGIKLVGRNGEDLDSDNLSSGEKHLLLLLSSAVLARSNGALMIIDEPELSLGLRWQRKLLSELLRCTEGSGVQFLVASHSTQIMADVPDIIRPTMAS
ncbi:AAA family ATPase [Plantibacter sp. MMLR14_011]|uniref:AAA family ATPase n=1 Tax=Plantibacter sp. MMLR14_011 TaxID=1898746 RepID=UPI0009F4FCDF|nr:AAA family ATPase [Plantibacter sp. MMLR14_011]